MPEPVQSTNYTQYYKLPDITWGMHFAPWRTTHRIWGLKPTIEFLLELGSSWRIGRYDDAPYSTICLGDISPEGGASNLPGRDTVRDHNTHSDGHAIDIFYIRNDGKSDKTYYSATHYSLQKNIGLGKLIFETANRLGLIIQFAYCDDPAVRKEVPRLTPSPKGMTNMHADHFHVYIVHPAEKKAWENRKT